MASGSSPRDRLVGMMYLVLTALLALQVSSAVLDKFILINRSMEKSTNYQQVENNDLVGRVRKMVQDSGNKASEVAVLKKMIDIRERTSSIASKIEAMKLELIKKAGGTPDNIKGLRNDAVVGAMMINNGKGAELKTVLNGYTEYLSEVIGKKYAPLALDAKDIDFLKNDPNQGRKDFVMLNFKKAPLAAALASLSQFLADVVYSEADALTTLAHTLGEEDYTIDVIEPIVIPDYNVVPTGGMYTARVIVSARSSTSSSDMTVNGKPIEVRDGVGYIKIPISSATKMKVGDTQERKLNVQVSMKNKKGAADVKSITESFFVTRPVITVESDAISALYMNCSNELNVNVPAYGQNFDPSFKTTGAKVTQRGGGKITVVPDGSSKKVKLNVYQKGQYVDNVEFAIRRVPLPQISVQHKGKPINEKRGLPAPGPRSLKLSVIPDASFKRFLPQEARYRVSKGYVTLARGDRPVGQRLLIKGKNINLSSLARNARPGDRVVLEILEVQRMTSFGTVETVEMPTTIKTIPITK